MKPPIIRLAPSGICETASSTAIVRTSVPKLAGSRAHARAPGRRRTISATRPARDDRTAATCGRHRRKSRGVLVQPSLTPDVWQTQLDRGKLLEPLIHSAGHRRVSKIFGAAEPASRRLAAG